MSIFYATDQVPVHSVLLLETRQEALQYSKGNIRLGFCDRCGFISNITFDASVHEYSSRYEATQGYSATFNAFHHRLATGLIDRYDLHGKTIVEIGCGQGEFLTLLCELGGNRGIGFDPAYVRDRSSVKLVEDVTFIADFYSEKYAAYAGDLICCKMTLEHIHQTADFVRTVRRAAGDKPERIIFFQVPNARYVFGEIAFWDVYYEHCSYFSLGSLARLFRRSGFNILNLWTDYEDQYLMLEAQPGNGQNPPLPQEDDLGELRREVGHFQAQYPIKVAEWRRQFDDYKQNGRKTVLWGGGSKGVAFLTALDISLDEIEYVVDINPHKAGTFMAGTGQEIVMPAFLRDYRPDVVIVMNPVYCQDVQRSLNEMGLSPELRTVLSV